MLDKIAVILQEDEKGQVSVQLHAGPDNALKSFKNMHGRVQDPPSRVSLVTIDYKNKETEVRTKDLPQNSPKDEQPDGIVLGKGPIWLDKEDENVSDSNG
jgi:hypothetical protein